MKKRILSILFVLLINIINVYPDSTQTCVQMPGSSENILKRSVHTKSTIPTSHFIIHYSDPTTYEYANNTANFAEYAYQEICAELGWQVPPADDNQGGDNRYDIYIVDESEIPGLNGVTVPEFPDGWNHEYCPSYIGIRNTIETESQLKMVVAHEFNHATQLAYSYLDGNSDTWFLENTAVWVAEEIYDYQYQYYKRYFNVGGDPADPLDYPEFGIHTTYQALGLYLYNYAGFLWPKFLAEWQSDPEIVRGIYERFGENPGEHVMQDINYVLQNYYETDLDEAARYYAEWRYFTGTRDDGLHFHSAYDLPTARLSVPSGFPYQQMMGYGGTVFLQYPSTYDIINFSFDGQDNFEWSASVIQERYEPPTNNIILPLNNNYSGTLDFPTEECYNLILTPIFLSDGVDKKSYTFSATNYWGKKVFLTNVENGTNSNLGGNLLLDNVETIPSGGFKWLRNNSSHNIKTLNERFTSNPINKHNNWNGSLITYFLSKPFTITTSNYNQTAKFKTLNSTTICNVIDGLSFSDGVPIKFNDPWFVKDANDNQSGMGDFISFSSPYLPTGKYNQSTGGVFINQPIETGKPYYSLKIDAVFDAPLYVTGNSNGRNHKFYFKGWSGQEVEFENSNALQTGIVFKDDIQGTNPLVKANLKGTQLSNQTDAYNYNNQRKYVKTDDGYLHIVYESMGSVWYEVSSDNGVNWTIQNNGNPVSTVGKQPSIDYDVKLNDQNFQILMVWQEKYGSYSKIKMAYFNREFDDPHGVMYLKDSRDIATVNGQYEYTNCTPVISFSTWPSNKFNVVYKNGSSGGLLCKSGSINTTSDDIVISGTPISLTGTTGMSSNPSIAVNKNNGATHLVWEQAQINITESINYATIQNQQISGSIVSISSGSGSSLNFNPSISMANGKPIVSWTGGVYLTPGGPISNKKAITSVGPTWGSFNISGSDVNYVNNNSAVGATEKTVIIWSQGTTNPTTRWIRRDGSNYTTPVSLTNTGYQSQICNGINSQNMSAMVFNKQNTPYYFLKSTMDFSQNYGEEIGPGLNKLTENDTIVAFGRSGVASINNIEFVFEIGDIVVGDSVIKFLGIPDTLVYTSTNELNQHTRTNNFTLTPEINFYFSNIYFVVQKSNPDTSLIASDAVNFKAELVNALTNQVVGTFDNITYNKNNLEEYASIDYEVDCSGITPGDYYLRLVTNVNGNANYSLANIISDNTTLAKKNFNKVNFTGSEIPTIYDLAQNYPNPFNPNTTIRYQLPQDGIVSIKIYDILGKEVKTLVNEQKSTGRYEVRFDASDLASGVYIYRIQSGSFINSKKMMLLK